MKPDKFDIERFPFGVRAGDNKGGWLECPLCQKPPTHPTKEEYPWDSLPPKEGFYMFVDELSAKEYKISGLCQSCQDKIFVEPVE